MSGYHTPVMLAEVLAWLQPRAGETHLDATLGGAGHSFAIAERLAPHGTLIGLDRDPEALREAAKTLAPLQESVDIILVHSAFDKMVDQLNSRLPFPERRLDGVLFDLGVSSHQLDAARGFSFRRDEPLDMRMNPTEGVSAAQFLETVEERELSRIFWEFGEERFANRIAREIVSRRNRGEVLVSTAQLAKIIESAIPYSARPKDIHPATRCFQGIRIFLNSELEMLEAGLKAAIDLLRPNGRVLTLSYHSLEDRIVKKMFAQEAGRIASPPGGSIAALAPIETPQARLEILTRKPISPSEAEVAANPRARSARLRAAKRID